MEQQTIIDELRDFIDFAGQFYALKEFLLEKGYTIEEINELTGND